jgi:hypothetical protein
LWIEDVHLLDNPDLLSRQAIIAISICNSDAAHDRALVMGCACDSFLYSRAAAVQDKTAKSYVIEIFAIISAAQIARNALWIIISGCTASNALQRMDQQATGEIYILHTRLDLPFNPPTRPLLPA